MPIHDGNQAPFKRGHTMFDKPASDTSLATTDGAEWEGTIWEFPDVNPHTGAKRSNASVICMIVRWTAAAGNALPSRLVCLDTDLVTNGGTSVAGPLGRAQTKEFTRQGATASVLAAKGWPADEYLPSAGVAKNDLFYIVLSGPAIVKLANVDNTGIDVGETLVAITGNVTDDTTSGATDAGNGLCGIIDLSVTTAPDGQQDRVVGTALSDAVTGYSDLLIWVKG